MNDSLIFPNYPNTMNTRWHKGKRVGVTEKPQKDWSDLEIGEIWTQKHGLIPVILWFAFLHISPLKIISINVVTSWTKYLCWFISLK